MFSKAKFIIAGLTIALGASVGVAQQQQNQTQNQAPDAKQGREGGRHFRRDGGFRGGFGRGLLQELNLTADQQQKIQAIFQQSMDGNGSTREEMRQLMEKRRAGTMTADEEARAKALREQMRASMKETESKISAILTPEQKAKLEELRKQREANHERFGDRRDRFRERQEKRSGTSNNPPTSQR